MVKGQLFNPVLEVYLCMDRYVVKNAVEILRINVLFAPWAASTIC